MAFTPPKYGTDPTSLAMQLRRSRRMSEEQIAEMLRMQGVPEDRIEQETGVSLSDDPNAAAPGTGDQGLDTTGADEGADEQPGPEEEDSLGLGQLSKDLGVDALGPSPAGEEDYLSPLLAPQSPKTIEQTVSRAIDPDTGMTQALRTSVNTGPDVGITPMRDNIGKILDKVNKVTAPGTLLDAQPGGDVVDSTGSEKPGGFARVMGMLSPDKPLGQGLMAAGLGMMSARGTYGNVGQAIGQGGLVGMSAYDKAKRQESIDQYRTDLNKQAKEKLVSAEKIAGTKEQSAKEARLLTKMNYLREMARDNWDEANRLYKADPDLQAYMRSPTLQLTPGPASWDDDRARYFESADPATQREMAVGGRGSSGEDNIAKQEADIMRRIRLGQPVSDVDRSIVAHRFPNTLKEARDYLTTMMRTGNGDYANSLRDMSDAEFQQEIINTARKWGASKAELSGIAGADSEPEPKPVKPPVGGAPAPAPAAPASPQTSFLKRLKP